MVQSGIGMNQNMMNGLGPSGVSSGPGTMIPTPGMSQQAQSGMQQLGVNNNSAVNMPLSQQTSGALQSSLSKYVKVWEGNLSGHRQGQPVFTTKLEGYNRSSPASKTSFNNSFNSSKSRSFNNSNFLSFNRSNNSFLSCSSSFLSFSNSCSFRSCNSSSCHNCNNSNSSHSFNNHSNCHRCSNSNLLSRNRWLVQESVKAMFKVQAEHN